MKPMYFVTSSFMDMLPVLNSDDYFESVIEPLTFLVSKNRINLFEFVLMYDHIHLLLSSSNVRKDISSLKSFSGKLISQQIQKGYKRTKWLDRALKKIKPARKYTSNYQIWMEGSDIQELRSKDQFHRVLNYIRRNPVASGPVEAPKEWKYSSANQKFLYLLTGTSHEDYQNLR